MAFGVSVGRTEGFLARPDEARDQFSEAIEPRRPNKDKHQQPGILALRDPH
jgi:hypothetical protein